MDTRTAQALILGTGITESNLQYRRQIGGGPALGLMQVEPETHEDLYNNFLCFHPDLLEVMHWLRGDGMSLSAALEENDVYACAVARLLYYRHADPLPILTPLALAHYHKKLYNTSYGATDPTKSQSCFKTAIETVNAQKGL